MTAASKKAPAKRAAKKPEALALSAHLELRARLRTATATIRQQREAMQRLTIRIRALEESLDAAGATPNPHLLAAMHAEFARESGQAIVERAEELRTALARFLDPNNLASRRLRGLENGHKGEPRSSP